MSGSEDLAGERSMNDKNIAEFRANHGRLSGPFGDAPVLLLHHFGARSGTEYVNPVMYQPVGDSYAIFASAAGRDHNPAWYHNHQAHPSTRVEVGDGSVTIRARVAEGEQRAEIRERQKEQFTNFAEYEQGTDRQIPVVILDPID